MESESERSLSSNESISIEGWKDKINKLKGKSEEEEKKQSEIERRASRNRFGVIIKENLYFECLKGH